MALTDAEFDILVRLDLREDIRSSDRPSDRARTRLKKLGLIIFDRSKWRWKITYAGQDALYAAHGARTPQEQR
jgi:hypothetical protein